jgi:transcriptional pleiotropic regulator of transition state genes
VRAASPLAGPPARPAGVVRRIDELGRVVIPIDIRKRLGLVQKDPLEVTVDGDAIVLTKPAESCVFCGGSQGLERYRGRAVCGSCIGELTR